MENLFSKLLISNSPSKTVDVSLYGRFIGAWDFDWSAPQKDGTKKYHKGEWIFSYILDGTAVQDLFICPSLATREYDKDKDAGFGTTLRIPLLDGSKKWQIIYAGDRGQKLDRLIAQEINGDIIQTGINYDPLDISIWQWNFREITENSFHWEAVWTEDHGVTWNLFCELDAVRRKKSSD